MPDNLKSGITHACRYEPEVNPTYLDLAQHYHTTVIPARAGKPKDKAKVENAVLVVERWILAAFRNHTFFSLAELNKTIAQKLVEFNNRKFQKLDGTRKQLFENLDKPALKPLPVKRYIYAEIQTLYEFRKAVSNEDLTFQEGKCLSFSQNVTYYPVIDILKSNFSTMNRTMINKSGKR